MLPLTLTMSIFLGLNPCCNGRGSKTFTTIEGVTLSKCLNPCCNGRGSKTYISKKVAAQLDTLVLILVVMEEGQRPRV